MKYILIKRQLEHINKKNWQDVTIKNFQVSSKI